MSDLKRFVPVVVAVVVTACVTLGAPAIAHGVHAMFAHEADKVDGLDAAKRPKPGDLLALNKKKKFPASVLPRAKGAVTIPVAAMEALDYSEHNFGSNVACGAAESSVVGGENGGDRDSSTGSFVGAVQLPNGVRVKRLDLVVNDGDNEDDVYAYLIRRDLKPDSPSFEGYSVMASVQSTGGVTTTLRRFSDGTVETPVVNNGRYMYLLELVDCGIPEPYGVRVTYS